MWKALNHARAAAGLGGALLIASVYLAYSYQDSQKTSLEQAEATQQNLAAAVELAASIQTLRTREDEGRLERLRLAIRSEVDWRVPQLARDGILWLDPEAPSNFKSDRDARRLHGLLRRSLDKWESAEAIELLVASEEGIWTHRVERRSEREWKGASSPRTPQTLWYAPFVQRALTAAGRGTRLGAVRWVPGPGAEGEQGDAAERPMSRRSIALQEPGEVIQGVLIVSFDARLWTERLKPLVTDGLSVDLETIEGRSLRTGMSSVEEGEYRLAQALGDEKDEASLFVVGRAKHPAEGWRAWRQKGAGLPFAALVAVVLLFVWAARAPVPESEMAEEIQAEPIPASEAKASSPPIVSEPFVLREWLGDIRSCLERDAARCGLNLSVRCHAALGEAITADASQLGGLLVAVGREALAQTPAQGIALEVRSDGPEGLCFEFETGMDEMVLAPALQEAAVPLCARFVSGEKGRVAVALAQGTA